MPPRSQREFTVGKFGDNAIPFCRPNVVPFPVSPHVLCFNTFPGRTLPAKPAKQTVDCCCAHTHRRAHPGTKSAHFGDARPRWAVLHPGCSCERATVRSWPSGSAPHPRLLRALPRAQGLRSFTRNPKSQKRFWPRGRQCWKTHSQ